MSLFAVFSGLNITLVQPMLDYIFVSRSEPNLYNTLPEFFHASIETFKHSLDGQGIQYIMEGSDHIKALLSDQGTVWLSTNQNILLKLLCGIVLILFILKNLFFFLEKITFIKFRGNAVMALRNNLFETYLYQSLTFFHRSNIGDAMVRVISDVSIVNDNFLMSVFTIIRSLVSIGIFVTIAIYYDAHLFVMSLLIIPLFTIVVNSVGNKIKKHSRRLQLNSADMFANVEEVLNNIRIVKAFCKEEHELKRFKKISAKYKNSWSRGRVYNSLNVPISEMNSAITGVIILLIGGAKVLSAESTLSFGDFMAFLFAMFSMLHPLKECTKAYASIRRAWASVERVYEIMIHPHDIKELPDAKRIDDFRDSIVFDNVSFAYEGGKEVIHSLSFTLHKGERIAFVGGSGAGKSTIINLLTRIYNPTSGEIRIDGTPIEQLKIDSYRSLFGTVTQESLLFSESIKYNIEYGTNDCLDEQQIKEAGKTASADEFIMKLPDAYHYNLVRKGANLSGGQKQRLCIARSIISNPQILLFDEATSALDTESEYRVQEAIERVSGDRTVVLIAHRLSTVLSSDKIIVLDDGVIVGSGSHDELLQSCQRYKDLYQLQLR
jgi:subfamily B ATP-binding cassette protein MsbA